MKKSSERIDGILALIMGPEWAMSHKPVTSS